MATESMRQRIASFRSGEDDEELQEAMDREEITWLEALRFMGRLMMRYPLAVTVTILLGIGIAASEILSVGLLLPFLNTLGGGGTAAANDTMLGFLMPYFEGMSAEDTIRFVALGLFAIQLLKGLLSYGVGRVAHYLRIVMDRDIRTEIFDQLLSVDLAFIEQEKVGNLYTILHSYPSDAARMARSILGVVPKAASFVGYLVVLLSLSWQLTLVALVLAAVANGSITFLTRIVRRMGREVNVYRVRLKQLTFEALHAMRITRLFNREDHMRDRFHDDLETYQAKRYQKSSVDAAVGPIYQTLMTGMFAAVLVAGTFVLSRSATSWVLILTVFMTVVMKLMGPTSRFARTRNKLAGKLPSIEELVDFFRRDDKPFMEDGSRPFRRLRHGVRFSAVRFRYGEDEPWAIRDVSFHLPRGRTVALVGGSGAGKSTLVSLLVRLHDPQGGRVTVDGVDLRDIQVGSWRRRLAVVSQDTFLFNTSVRENIRFGRLDASNAEVEWAAKQANAHGFITDLPEGYDTVAGDRGVRLSGGQAQRIAIARALLADPEVLVLDEATSALDTETERKVQEALDRVSENRTVLAIAHRLSTVQDADEIVVLEHGEVVERGSHDELLAREGRYWEYVQMQNLLEDPWEGASAGRPDEAAELRIEVEEGRATGRICDNGRVLGEVPLVAVEARDGVEGGVEGLLGSTRGDLAVVRNGVATVRLGEDLFDEVPVESSGSNSA